MVSTFTPNINLEEPARGDDVGTWDTPVNNNTTVIDLVEGGISTVSLNNSPIVLSAAQFQSNGITFNSTLTGSVTITFPTSFKKPYFVRNTCTGSSAFTITLQTTASGGQVICCPPGESVDVVNDGTNLYFHNFGRIGEYMDIIASSMPNWISGCTVPPYLNCDGTTFSSATYPQLAVRIGGTTLPDSRGKSRFALDQSAGLISSAATGFSGSSVGSVGGAQTTTLGTSNLPAYTPSVTAGGVTALGVVNGSGATLVSAGGATPFYNTGAYQAITGVAQGGVSAPLTNLPPAFIGGLTLVRAG